MSKSWQAPAAWIALSIAIFATLALSHDLIYFRDFCFHSFDLGIYMQAVQKLSWHDWNPFLSCFGQKFLNDHWHPALLLARIPALIMPLSAALIVTEVFFCLAQAMIPVALARGGRLHPSAAALISAYLLVNQRQLEAAMYPVHPAVWANFFLLGATALLIWREGDPRSQIGAFLAVFSAGFFGEQFALALLGYSLAVALCTRGRLRSIFMVGISAAWVWFSLSGRAIWLGPILHQTERVALSPSAFFAKYSWNLEQLRGFLKFFFEAAPLLFFAWKLRTRPRAGTLLPVAGIFLPLILGRILSASFGFQYDTLLVCSMAAFAILTFESSRAALSNRALAFSFIFFVLASYSKFEKTFWVVTETKLPNCVHTKPVKPVNTERLRDLNQAIAEIKSSGPGKRILAIGNLVPNLVQSLPNDEVFGLERPSHADWIVLERGVCGDPWPWGEERILNYSEQIERLPGLKIIKNTPCLLLAQGPGLGSVVPSP